ncbi:hypothetical protein PC129_g18006 [Phytophthora cactorum]|uniref:Apple domain-containing protein n=4 Tax=Phytophthora cactorum TaxID=29920 RepID=A0A329S1Z2_9STRA|nr:hypothetical protein Pcac1_g16708 [Phytophthora cactorum]KAG2775995.1 hypothetical protein Pcac1_g13414 [Phytophthora cactorum]KAG2824326.1 hypothetical protein PC111_g9869 [Phytophthora cactorum]KAG2842320.1 hypothetical protein PC112_g3072 [Phytophthora cactorum]KAG2857075.1 hypothetical protein PC113_g11006 [Phytophthora cactorum]
MLGAQLLVLTVGVLAAVAEAAGTCPSIENNVDYSGADVGSARSSSANGCCSICSSTNGCGAFTWTNYNGGTCWLKQSKGTAKTSNGAVSAVLQTASAAGTCPSLENNVDYSGADAGSAPSSSANGCCSICSKTNGCGAFTWTNYNGGTCWLKQSKGTGKASNGAISGVVQSSSSSSATCPSLENNVDYSGADVGSAQSANANGCCSICSNNNACGAFTWTSYNGGTCWLKSSKGSSKASPGSISSTVQKSNTGGNTGGGWSMSPVKVIQARVQGDAPIWHPEVGLWLSKYGTNTEQNYVNNLDTVNMASVEGALMYVQAEGINVNEQSVKCQRKNQMQYVVFYEMTIVQPTNSIKYYENHSPPEYGDFVAMDGAKCTNAGSDIPKSCKVYYGLDGTKDIGPNVGCNPQGSDPRAPYPNNYWCSFPNSCAQKYRADKTSECRAQYDGGLCPMGVQPDGVKCTYNYKILGYLNIDDLVGIIKMGFSNYQQFCQSGGIEFKARNTGRGFEVEQCIDFWKNPGDQNANANRASQMVTMYNQLISSGKSPNMSPLPSVESMAASNPKCYQNSAVCARAQFGCKRSLFSQICSVCSSAEAGCEKAPAGYSFPNLTLPPGN